MNLPAELADEKYCYLSTQGRVTGRRHTAELWFVPAEGGVYLMSGSGGLTQWCLNLQAEEQGVLRIGTRSWLARVTFLAHDDPDRYEAACRHGGPAGLHPRADGLSRTLMGGAGDGAGGRGPGARRGCRRPRR